jgi:hypothetical protein
MCAQVFMAEPFNAEVDRLEATGRGGKGGASGMQAPGAVLPSSVPREGAPGFRRYTQLRRINWGGSIIMAIYFAALCFYMYVRVAKTLDLGRCARAQSPPSAV